MFKKLIGFFKQDKVILPSKTYSDTISSKDLVKYLKTMTDEFDVKGFTKALDSQAAFIYLKLSFNRLYELNERLKIINRYLDRGEIIPVNLLYLEKRVVQMDFFLLDAEERYSDNEVSIKLLVEYVNKICRKLPDINTFETGDMQYNANVLRDLLTEIYQLLISVKD